MKEIPILLLILRASITSACASYYYCHCQNSDLSANNDATTAVCDFISKYYGGSVVVSSDGLDECQNSGLAYQGIPDNCLFKDFCLIVGAQGPDSSCHGTFS
jgi:hypothetical protein